MHSITRKIVKITYNFGKEFTPSHRRNVRQKPRRKNLNQKAAEFNAK